MLRKLVLLISFITVSGCDSEPPVLKLDGIEGAYIESPATSMPDISFTTHDNKTFTKSDFKGHWSLVFFGYTHCPDVCPTSMNVFADMLDDKSTPASQFYFASVDPKRDTPEQLAKYLPFFHEDIIGLTTTESELQKLRDPLGVIYDYEEETAPGEYIVTHFAALYIIDSKARMRAYILPPHTSARVNDIYKKIRKHYEN